MVGERPAGGRRVLDGAFALLEALGHGEEVGLTRLAADAGLPKATAHRLLDQLAALGAVQRRAGQYRLGSRMFRFGQAWQPAQSLRAAAARPLRQLAMATNAAGFCLAVPDGDAVMLVAGIGREVNEVFPLRAGTVLPPGTAAELILATATDVQEPPHRCSGHEWARRVGDARRAGLAYDHEKRFVPLVCVAAPVRTPDGRIVAALAASMLDATRLPSLAEAVRRAAGIISGNLRSAAHFRRELPQRVPARDPSPLA